MIYSTKRQMPTEDDGSLSHFIQYKSERPVEPVRRYITGAIIHICDRDMIAIYGCLLCIVQLRIASTMTGNYSKN
jgi:hypothetical protein